jgi:hypothetical protein
MSAWVWVNVMLGVPFLLVWVGIPLWMTFKRPDTPPDFSAARAYLNAKAALVTTAEPEPTLAAAA